MKQFICALTLCFASSIASASAITITSSNELDMARQVSSALSDLTGNVTRCVDEEDKAIEVCRCENETGIARLREIYAEAINVFPEWSDKTVNFAREQGSNTTTALNFKMLPHAIANACP